MASQRIKNLILKLSARGLLNFMSDKAYLKLMFKVRMGKKLNLKNPQTYNEKLQWLKLYDRNPKYIRLVDKFEVKKYISDKIGEEYVIPTLGVWDKFDDIDFDALPNQFVLKCTHDSGGLVICKDKSNFDFYKAKEKIERSLKTNFYWHGREWPYKKVNRKIIAEKYMVDESGYELKDYKFYCFNGEPKIVLVCSNRFGVGGLKENYYDLNWNLQNIMANDISKAKILPPNQFSKMIELCRYLSENIPHVRVDFYEINNKIYFGELTFFSQSGFEQFSSDEWANKFGEWIKLPKELK